MISELFLGYVQRLEKLLIENLARSSRLSIDSNHALPPSTYGYFRFVTLFRYTTPSENYSRGNRSKSTFVQMNRLLSCIPFRFRAVRLEKEPIVHERTKTHSIFP
jgi:hypothetical protein